MKAVVDLFPENLLIAISKTMLHSLWEGAVISILAFMVLILVRRSAPRLRYAVLGSSILLLLISVTATFLYFFDSGKQAGTGELFAVSAGSTEILPSSTNEAVQPLATVKGLLSGYFDQYASWMSLIWFLGMMIFMLKSFGGILYSKRIRTRSRMIDNAALHERMANVAKKLGVKGRVIMAESWQIGAPVLVGFIRPMIIFPVGLLTGLTASQVESILAHELMHVKRKDYLINVLQSVTEAVLFFNPAVWWLSSQLRIEREHICDDAATAVTGQPLDYAKALAIVEEGNLPVPGMGTSLIGQKKLLLNRIQRMMNMKKSTNRTREGLMAATLAFLAAFVLSAGAAITYNQEMDMSQKFLNMDRPVTAPVQAGMEAPMNSIEVETIVHAMPDSGVVKEMDTVNAEKKKVIVIHKKEITDEAGEMEEILHLQAQERILQEHEIEIQEKLNDLQEKLIAIDIDMDLDTSFVFIYNGDTIQGSGFWHGSEGGDVKGIHEFYFEMPEFETVIPDIEWHQYSEQMEDAMKANEKAMEEIERFQRYLFKDKEADVHRYYHQPAPEQHDKAYGYYFEVPEMMHLSKTDKIIRQELLSDHLIERGGEYVVELNNKEMVINGEKQPRGVQKKYERLYEALEDESPVNYKKIL